MKALYESGVRGKCNREAGRVLRRTLAFRTFASFGEAGEGTRHRGDSAFCTFAGLGRSQEQNGLVRARKLKWRVTK